MGLLFWGLEPLHQPPKKLQLGILEGRGPVGTWTRKELQKKQQSEILPSLLNPPWGKKIPADSRKLSRGGIALPKIAWQPHPNRARTSRQGVMEQDSQQQEKPVCQGRGSSIVSICPSKQFQRLACSPLVWAACNIVKVFSHSATMILASLAWSLTNDFAHHLVISLLSFLGNPQVVAIEVEGPLYWCMWKVLKGQSLTLIFKGLWCYFFLLWTLSLFFRREEISFLVL